MDACRSSISRPLAAPRLRWPTSSPRTASNSGDHATHTSNTPPFTTPPPFGSSRSSHAPHNLHIAPLALMGHRLDGSSVKPRNGPRHPFDIPATPCESCQAAAHPPHDLSFQKLAIDRAAAPLRVCCSHVCVLARPSRPANFGVCVCCPPMHRISFTEQCDLRSAKRIALYALSARPHLYPRIASWNWTARITLNI